MDQTAAAVVTGAYVHPTKSRISVGEWAPRWLAAQGQLKPSTRARYAGIVRVQVLPRWGTTMLADITHADVASWVSSLPLAPASVRQVHRVFSLIFDLAVRDGRLARNPAARVPLPRVPQPDRRFLTHGEADSLARAAGSYDVLIRLLAFTGLRFGEAAALRVARLDLLRRRIEVAESVTEVGGRAEFGTPKTHQRRAVLVTRSLADALATQAAAKRPEDYVFTAEKGGILRLRNWRRAVFDPATVAAGLTGLTPHDLRHTVASLAVSAGANVKAVQRLLGHASAAMTLDVYSGLFDEDLDVLVDRLEVHSARALADSARTAAPVIDLHKGRVSR